MSHAHTFHLKELLTEKATGEGPGHFHATSYGPTSPAIDKGGGVHCHATPFGPTSEVSGWSFEPEAIDMTGMKWTTFDDTGIVLQ